MSVLFNVRQRSFHWSKSSFSPLSRDLNFSNPWLWEQVYWCLGCEALYSSSWWLSCGDVWPQAEIAGFRETFVTSKQTRLSQIAGDSNILLGFTFAPHRLKLYSLTFRHRAFCILGQAFHSSPENAFYIFNQPIYFIIWFLLDRASLI